MKLRATIALSVLVLLLPERPARADVHVRFPGDVPVDIYHSGGPLGFLNDGEWAVIPFWRPLESIPADFNLVHFVDPEAVDLPLLVEGIARIRGDHPVSWEARGLGAAPFVFVLLSELQAAIADDDITIVELLSLPSLQVGTASFYQEQNHIFGFHPVSHYTMVARGTLEDGRSFDVLFVEYDLELLQTKIVFK